MRAKKCGEITFACRLVADDVQAHESAVTASTVLRARHPNLFADTSLEPLAFVTMSSAGSIEPVHFDESGFHTLTSAVDGSTLFLIAVPTSDTASTPPKIADGDSFTLMRGKDVMVYLVMLKAGTHL